MLREGYMKCVLMVLVSIFTTASFASESSLFRLPIGAKVSTHSLKLSRSVQATMDCDFYNTRVENNQCKESELLASNKSQAIEVGTPTLSQINFPAPYQDISVVFNHTLIAYGESGENNFMPYIQSFFMNKDQFTDDFRDASFDISDARLGSKVLLRGTYNFSDTSMLSYQCSINFIN